MRGRRQRSLETAEAAVQRMPAAVVDAGLGKQHGQHADVLAVVQVLIDDALRLIVGCAESIKVTARDRIDVVLVQVLDVDRVREGRADIERDRVDEPLHGRKLAGRGHVRVRCESSMVSTSVDPEGGMPSTKIAYWVRGRPTERPQNAAGKGTQSSRRSTAPTAPRRSAQGSWRCCARTRRTSRRSAVSAPGPGRGGAAGA